jgi:hypothetical protein
MSVHQLDTITCAAGLGLRIEEDNPNVPGSLELRTLDGRDTLVRRVWSWDEAQAFMDGAAWQYGRKA